MKINDRKLLIIFSFNNFALKKKPFKQLDNTVFKASKMNNAGSNSYVIN